VTTSLTGCIEEELHEKAHIDYDRVAIVSTSAWPQALVAFFAVQLIRRQIPNPSVPALYEDALVSPCPSQALRRRQLTAQVYEPGSGISSTGALTAYSGAKTGRSPSDKRIVKEPSSENEVWYGTVFPHGLSQMPPCQTRTPWSAFAHLLTMS